MSASLSSSSSSSSSVSESVSESESPKSILHVSSSSSDSSPVLCSDTSLSRQLAIMLLVSESKNGWIGFVDRHAFSASPSVVNSVMSLVSTRYSTILYGSRGLSLRGMGSCAQNSSSNWSYRMWRTRSSYLWSNMHSASNRDRHSSRRHTSRLRAHRRSPQGKRQIRRNLHAPHSPVQAVDPRGSRHLRR